MSDDKPSFAEVVTLAGHSELYNEVNKLHGRVDELELKLAKIAELLGGERCAG